jgi:hypothetical protein
MLVHTCDPSNSAGRGRQLRARVSLGKSGRSSLKRKLSKKGQRHSSRVERLSSQVQGPEFNLHYYQKTIYVLMHDINRYSRHSSILFPVLWWLES